MDAVPMYAVPSFYQLEAACREYIPGFDKLDAGTQASVRRCCLDWWSAIYKGHYADAPAPDMSPTQTP